jgi:polyferredoxin
MKKKRLLLSTIRKFSQVLFLAVFVFLFIKTDYSGKDEIGYAVNIFFRIDPFLAVCASLAQKGIILLLLPSIITLFLTFVFGRFFCGWVCPLGTLLDFSHPFFKPRHPDFRHFYRNAKYYLLFFLLAGSLFGFPAYGYFDPFSILVRSLVFSVHPNLNETAASFFTFTYQNGPDWLNTLTEPIYALLKSSILPFRQTYFELSLLSLAILMIIFFLEAVQRRFFCKNICPLGALLAFVARFSLLRGFAGGECKKCLHCRTICRMGAISETRLISQMDCNLCLDCVDICPEDKISFGFGNFIEKSTAPNFSRRILITSFAGGAILPLFLRTRPLFKQPDPALIRPPGALAERLFTDLCVRCGECMKVCIGNALQPSFLEAGIEGMFTPRLEARIGYCEYNCTLCGQVCPSGAIRQLTRAKKQRFKIGSAYFDKNRCLPYAQGIPCIVCEEHCPTPDKAIKFRETEVLNSKGSRMMVKQPYIVDELCIGCGICENKCPLPGNAAVFITSAGESRHPDQGETSSWVGSSFS